MDYLKTLMAERETLAATIAGYAAKAETRGSDLTDTETAEVKDLQTRCASIDDRLSAFASAQESNQAYADLSARIGKTAETRTAIKTEERNAPESVGSLFTASEEFRSYKGHGRSGVVNVEAEFRASGPTLLADLPGLPRTQFAQPVGEDLYPLFGLVGAESLSTNAFDYVVTTFTDASAVVAEGEAKPESDFLETLVPGTLDTIAHWVQISRQALEDSARVRSVIDGKLQSGVLKKQHASIGAALVAATLPTNVFAGGATSDPMANLLKSARQGIGKVQAAGFSPNALLMNPADYAALDIVVMGSTLNGPIIHQSFWGLRPVAYSGQAAGTITVGDFSQGATLFRRSGVAVYATDSHASTFTSNIVTLLGEARSKAVVTNTAAFVECSETHV